MSSPSAAGACASNSYAHPLAQCVSYNSNVGNAVYEGAELRLVQRFAPLHLFATVLYGLNVSYPEDLNAQFSNPTSGGNLVGNAQFLGIPQQQGSLQLDWSNNGWHSAAGAIFRGTNLHLTAVKVLAANGLSERDLQVINMDSATTAAAGARPCGRRSRCRYADRWRWPV